jgi:epoxyqueuosine reductase
LSGIGGLAGELRRLGEEAGLDHLGICDAGPFTDVRVMLEERRADGTSAGMQFTYRNPARSTDPSATLPGARSLVVGCVGYSRQAPPAGPEAYKRGAVAKYSWVDHYATLRSGLAVVAACLRANGWKASVVADDNALVDRAAAVRAGLGWYGKNCNVLLPGEGSMFVLGSVITDALLLEGPGPPPVPDGCGGCRHCLGSCPTGALTSPGRLDARRCLAWLLQAPGVFPVEHRAALGDRIYGCDACQDSCPANRVALLRSPPLPAPPGSQAAVDVLEVLDSDDAELERRVGRWYIPGREMRYVRRNALVVLANVGDGIEPAVEAALCRALRDSDPVIRAHAVWAARRLGRSDLLAGMQPEHDRSVIEELIRPEVPTRDRSGATEGSQA